MCPNNEQFPDEPSDACPRGLQATLQQLEVDVQELRQELNQELEQLRQQNQDYIALMDLQQFEDMMMAQNDPAVFQQQLARLRENIARSQAAVREIFESEFEHEELLEISRQRIARLQEMEQRILTHRENGNLG